jgi:Ca2+-binding RTX toxin-like protein
MRQSVSITATLVLCAAGSAAYPLASAGATVSTCQGLAATIVGTDGRDDITGTTGRDVIAAGKGWDHVDGRDGDDVICGGRGADNIQGGPGNDRVYGEADGLLYNEDQYGDVLTGGPGNDYIDGGPGLYGTDRGLDRLRFPNAGRGVVVDLAAQTATLGDAHDRVVNFEAVTGTPYADRLYGDSYYQTLNGLGGNDDIRGRGYIDYLFAGPGDDHLFGGDGDDYLVGDTGYDVGRAGQQGRYGDRCVSLEVEYGCES